MLFLSYLANQPATAPHPEPEYHYTQEVYQELAPYLRERPDQVQAEQIGLSHEGRPLWAFHVHDPGRASVGSLLVFANIHAMEWVPTEIALAWLKESIENPRPIDLTVIPILNPDGRSRVEEDLRAGRNRYRRGNAVPVDLNRDFTVNRQSQALWRGLLPGYYRTSPGPLSQPESQALDRLAARDHYDAAVSLHSFGGFLYYPWTGRMKHAPDWRTFHTLGLTMQAAMGVHAYTPKQLSHWAFFFRALGTEIDHLYGRYGTLAFLVETTRSGIETPADAGTYFRWYNPRKPLFHVQQGLRILRTLAQEVVEGRARRVPPPELPTDPGTNKD